MTDDPEIEETGEEPAEEPKGPVAGERLAAARREQQISIDEVAKELHLDEPKVRALERNEFEQLGAPVFAKGHLRKYAQLVGISIDEALAEYEALNTTADEPPLVIERPAGAREISPGPWIGVILVVIIAAAYWWFAFGQAPGEEPPAPAADVDAPEMPAAAEPEAAAPDDAVTEPLPEESPPVPEADDAVAEDSDAAVQVPPADQSTLTLSFAANCWTEVTDADGQRLFYALGREGRTVDLDGRAPFAVVLGDADAVTIEIDGEPFEIPATARSGRMARLSIVAR